jgi:hypothetical protein
VKHRRVGALSDGRTQVTEPGTLTPLPDRLTPRVEARVGTVDFIRGLPTKKGIDQLFEIQDFQRATQLSFVAVARHRKVT